MYFVCLYIKKFRGCWDLEEDLKILEKVLTEGPKWAALSKEMKCRSENSIKNRYLTLMGLHLLSREKEKISSPLIKTKIKEKIANIKHELSQKTVKKTHSENFLKELEEEDPSFAGKLEQPGVRLNFSDDLFDKHCTVNKNPIFTITNKDEEEYENENEGDERSFMLKIKRENNEDFYNNKNFYDFHDDMLDIKKEIIYNEFPSYEENGKNSLPPPFSYNEYLDMQLNCYLSQKKQGNMRFLKEEERERHHFNSENNNNFFQFSDNLNNNVFSFIKMEEEDNHNNNMRNSQENNSHKNSSNSLSSNSYKEEKLLIAALKNLKSEDSKKSIESLE